MHVDSNHPGLKHFREVKARDRAIAIIRAEVKSNNPDISDSRAHEIAKASYIAKQRTVSKKTKRPTSRRPQKAKQKENRGLTVKLGDVKVELGALKK